MDQINVHDAKTNLSRLLERVERGEHNVIARAGKPIADLVPHAASAVTFDILSGQIEISDDAFAWPDATIENLFYGDLDPSRHE